MWGPTWDHVQGRGWGNHVFRGGTHNSSAPGPEVTPQHYWQRQPLGKATATHPSVLAWRIPWTGAWQAVVHRVAKGQSRLKRLSTMKTETSKPNSRHSLMASSEPSTGPDTRKTGKANDAVCLHVTIQCNCGMTSHIQNG